MIIPYAYRLNARGLYNESIRISHFLVQEKGVILNDAAKMTPQIILRGNKK
jgi:hypothetical protein